MAKGKKKNVNNNVKNKSNVSKKQETSHVEAEANVSVYTSIKVLVAVLVFLASFYLLTVLLVSDGSSKKKQETEFQFFEVLAGSSFDLNGSPYYVVYFDASDEELSSLYSTVYTYSYSGNTRLYYVDLSSGFNKPFISEKSNKTPTKASELAINGPTLIKFNEGKVEEYIEGAESISSYLKK